MSKYRICPDCGLHNPLSLVECSGCEADLNAVPVVDDSTAPKTAEAAPNPAAKMVRICGCGARNPAAMRKCAECGEDISDVIPSEDKQDSAPQFLLASVDGEYAYELTQPETVLGREREMREYLAAMPFVSRTHAKLETQNGRLYITNLSTTNFTYVNNVRITGRQELLDGDEIGLGGNASGGKRQQGAAYFVARICPCT
ncbi:MAG: FHA domain-containing protein [Oscillospiraceae bacterium]